MNRTLGTRITVSLQWNIGSDILAFSLILRPECHQLINVLETRICILQPTQPLFVRFFVLPMVIGFTFLFQMLQASALQLLFGRYRWLLHPTDGRMPECNDCDNVNGVILRQKNRPEVYVQFSHTYVCFPPPTYMYIFTLGLYIYMHSDKCETSKRTVLHFEMKIPTGH